QAPSLQAGARRPLRPTATRLSPHGPRSGPPRRLRRGLRHHVGPRRRGPARREQGVRPAHAPPPRDGVGRHPLRDGLRRPPRTLLNRRAPAGTAPPARSGGPTMILPPAPPRPPPTCPASSAPAS